MNDHQYISDAVEFELKLCSLILKDEPWKIPLREVKFTKSERSWADDKGVMKISTIGHETHAELREQILTCFVDLHTNFAPRDRFMWQRVAKRIGLMPTILAVDVCECQYCGMLTPLTRTKRCIQCRKVEDAVRSNPDLAEQVLKSIQALEFTEEEKYGVEDGD